MNRKKLLSGIQTNKMRYRDFDIIDFLNDEFFIQWVKNPGEETNHFWMKWIENNPDRKHIVQKAREIIILVDYQTKYELSDQAYMDLYENIVEKSNREGSDRNFFHWGVWHKVAAILFLAFSTAYSINYFIGLDNKEVQTQQVTKWLSVYNPAGQKYRFKLDDGTIVHLNSESSVEYPETFDSSRRVIRMKGEAFFNVAKDKDRPFIIETEDNQVKVIGTSFNLKNREKFELALEEGKVEVEGETGEVISLLPNEMLIKTKDGDVSMTTFDPMEVFGWKEQYLIFKDDSFEEVVDKIEAWFGVQIISKITVESDWSYSGKYHDKPLSQVLDGISISSEFDYKIESKTVTILNPQTK
ncbi:FecR family protein [Algoriphagus sp. D3-2-R+10]|uniref:FecR family protein n=1 Tax=Algoriphagus aurantiacus TaxID=3103948 RepID=UPI002B3BA819|nr:FecR family protein [Algoriphagus sp. D3-2-R+10]MEB2775342.1 FecR family protein [Algoriphagus sp. D3-2-R+10]